MPGLITLRGKLASLAAAVALALVGVAGAWGLAFGELKVNGPVYGRIVQTKDLVADILPPPEYILESYLVASQAMTAEPGEVAGFKDAMLRLRKDYDERHAFWSAQGLDASVRDGLLVESYAPAVRFYDRAFATLFPALEQGDHAAAAAAFKEMGGLYATHRKAIDRLVLASDTLSKSVEQDAAAQEGNYKLIVGLITLGASILALGIVLAVARAITAPLGRLGHAVTRLGEGALDTPVPETGRADEFGPLALALERWRLTLIEAGHRAGTERAEQARRDERQKQVEAATRRFDGVVISLLNRIRSTVESLHVASDALSATAEQTHSQSAAVSAATEQSAANVESVAAAGNQLSAAIGEISSKVGQSSAIVQAASSEAETANARISGLTSAVDKIGQVLNLINDVASQTNLLALNATIEAARAGDAGKGFAVVAHEVKNLAGQTSRATDDIARQIAAVQEETRSAVGALAGIADTISRVNEMSSSIAGAVQQQGAAASDISRNVAEAAAGSREVVSNISGVVAAAGETGAMARTVFQAANELMEQSRGLEREVEGFLKEIA